MAGAAELTRLVSQLRSASTAVERMRSMLDEQISSLEGLREQLDSSFEGVRGGAENLSAEVEEGGGSAEAKVQGLVEVAEAGSGGLLPAASDAVAGSSSGAEASHQEQLGRLTSLTEEVRRGFAGLAGELAGAEQRDTESLATVSQTFSDLVEQGTDAREGLLSAEAGAVELFEATAASLESDTQPVLEAESESAANEVESQANVAEQAAEREKSQLQQGYLRVRAAQEAERGRLVSSVREAVETTSANLRESAAQLLETPGSETVHEHAPSASAALEAVGQGAGDWNRSCGALAGAAGELDRGYDSMERLDAMFEGRE